MHICKCCVESFLPSIFLQVVCLFLFTQSLASLSHHSCFGRSTLDLASASLLVGRICWLALRLVLPRCQRTVISVQKPSAQAWFHAQCSTPAVAAVCVQTPSSLFSVTAISVHLRVLFFRLIFYWCWDCNGAQFMPCCSEIDIIVYLWVRLFF